MHWRRGISRRVYQKPVINVKPLLDSQWYSPIWPSCGGEGKTRIPYGVTAASKMPMMTSGIVSINHRYVKRSRRTSYGHWVALVIEHAHFSMHARLTSTREIATLGHNDDRKAPGENTDCHDLLRRKSSDQPPARILTEEVSSVYHCPVY
jgi:hypothetical protein